MELWYEKPGKAGSFNSRETAVVRGQIQTTAIAKSCKYVVTVSVFQLIYLGKITEESGVETSVSLDIEV